MKTFKLKHPITVAGVDMKEVTLLRRAKAHDLERLDNVTGPVAKSIALIANLAEISPDQVREIDAEDFTVIEKEAASFLG